MRTMKLYAHLDELMVMVDYAKNKNKSEEKNSETSTNH